MKKRWYEITLFVPPTWSEILPHFLKEKGFSDLWEEREKQPPHRPVIRAYLPEELWLPTTEKDLETDLKELSRIFSTGLEAVEFTFCLIEEEDWVSQWLPFFEPLKIGPVWVRPNKKSVRLAEGEHEIIIDPGQAFGTGHHESTQLCLESILSLRPSLENDTPILDLGTGSGILAMFAVKMGFEDILAVDTDPLAVEAAGNNLQKNGLEANVVVSEEPIESLEKRFGLILANLSTTALEGLAGQIVLHMGEGGLLIVSGILMSDVDQMSESFCPKGLTVVNEKTKNDWACLTFRKS